MYSHAKIVELAFSLLISLDVLAKFKVVADSVENKVQSRIYGWKMLIIRKNGYFFLVSNFASVLFTKGELNKFHPLVSHPSKNKLLNSLKEHITFTPMKIVGKF